MNDIAIGGEDIAVKPLSVKDRLFLDLVTYGISVERKNPDGTSDRIDPWTVRFE